MDKKYEFLKKYIMKKNGYIRLLSLNEIDNNLILLPERWFHIFKGKDMKKRIKMILDLWKLHVNSEMSNTIAYLNDYLVEVELMEINYRYSILYSLKNRNGEVLYYEGRAPAQDFKNPELEKIWDKFPEKVRDFYENVHNGFYYYASGSMGLVPLEEVVFLGDDDFDWSIVSEIEEPLKINLDTSFGFFSNGIGTYVVIDYTNCNQNNATLWSAKEQPEYNIDFWDCIDEWTVIGFD